MASEPSLHEWRNLMGDLVELNAWLIKNTAMVTTRIQRDSEAYVRSAGFGGKTSSPEIPDPTGNQATNLYSENSLCDLKRLTRLTRHALRTLGDMKSEMHKALPIEKKDSDKIFRTEGQSCSNPVCNTRVDGTQDDRLRGDRCEPCYRYWLRADKKAERTLRLVLRGEVGTKSGDK